MIIAQISDTHIVPKGQDWKSLPETKVADRLKLIVKNLNSLNPKPDVVLHTGDAIDDGGLVAYNYLKEILEPLTMPYYVIPGNHDDREDMQAAFQHANYMPSEGFINYVIDDYDIRLIALDTVIPHETEGLLCEERVKWLQKALEQDTQKPTLIFMHHPLTKTGQKLLDKVKCYVPDGFESFITGFPNIVGIISGHYHKSCASIFGGTLCFVGPSVAPVHYFEKASDEETKVIELVRPSFVLHKWLDDTHLVSEVVQTLEAENRLTVARTPHHEMD
jgi:3',5'-cyclic AMP phosphodiesterase CpdA